MKYNLIIISVLCLSFFFACKKEKNTENNISEDNSSVIKQLQDSIYKQNRKITSLENTIKIYQSRDEYTVAEETVRYWSGLQTVSSLRKKGIDDPEIQKVILQLTEEMNNLKRENEYLFSTQLLTYWFDSLSVEMLQDKGIKNPQKDILKDLKKHEELIADKAILGGTMRFSNMTLLGNNWAIADGEDGHVAYFFLLRYEIGNNKSIKWTVIDSSSVF